MALVPPAVLTVTSTMPAPGGEVAVQLVATQSAEVAALVAKATVAPAGSVPVMVITVPPAAGPDVGAMALRALDDPEVWVMVPVMTVPGRPLVGDKLTE